ncbi:MAG: CoA transferase, partial [Vicinamibacterales bacterium]
MALPLDNLLVHEAATTVAGQLFGRLLAEQGADVAMLRAPRDGFAERFLARKKRTGWQDAQAPHIVIVDGNPSNLPSDLSEETIRARWPGASYVSITPYGRTGTWANVPGDDATADALSGTMSLRGTGTGGPNAAAPHVVQQAGAYAAYVAVMQHLLRKGPDSPAVIDVSLAETALLFAEMHASYVE